eukprot:c24102_g1_i1 orf=157-1095(+)
MGAQLARFKAVAEEEKQLADLLKAEGDEFPGCDHEATDLKEWMDKLDLDKVRLKDVVWPGTHDSATNRIGIPFVSRPFAQCQNMSAYDQFSNGVRVCDIRVEKNCRVCHGCLKSYHVKHVLEDVKRFLAETKSEVIILEIRTEYKHEDPPDFDKMLIEQLGDNLIPQDPHVFDKTLRELLPKRLICVWKPQKAPAPSPGSPLWSSAYLKDNWTDTDLPYEKFQNNLTELEKQAPVHNRKYFYRVENTCTPQADNVMVCVKPVTRRIQPYARLFISQAHKKGLGDRLQIFSSDFVDADFVRACIAATHGRTAS